MRFWPIVAISALGALVVFFVVACAPAFAHDLWRNGEPVPAWVKQSCCGAEDAHNLPDEDVRIVPGGYIMRGWPHVIPFAKTQPSPDGTYWIFYSGPFLYCVFVPVGSS